MNPSTECNPASDFERCRRFLLLASICALSLGLASSAAANEWLVYEGPAGPGKGKHIVLLAGDEEYRSEEALPMLAKILAMRHGFKCTVVLPINPTTGLVDPNTRTNLPGIGALDSADVCVMSLRFREPPNTQMKHFVDYWKRGKPFVALRTSTHAFNYDANKQSPYAKFDWRSKEWPGGFGQQVLGETWVNHHGDHGKQSSRGVVRAEAKASSILRGVEDVWGPTDVYGVTHLPKDAEILLWGQVLTGMKPGDPPLDGPKNNPMMPLAWTRVLKSESGATQKIFTTTMGASVDFESEGLRRLVVNACFWAADLEVPARADVKPVGEYKPTMFGFGKFKPGVKPADL